MNFRCFPLYLRSKKTRRWVSWLKVNILFFFPQQIWPRKTSLRIIALQRFIPYFSTRYQEERVDKNSQINSSAAVGNFSQASFALWRKNSSRISPSWVFSRLISAASPCLGGEASRFEEEMSSRSLFSAARSFRRSRRRRLWADIWRVGKEAHQ